MKKSMLNIQTLKCKSVENQNMFVWLVWNHSNQQLCVFSKNLIDLHKRWRNFSGLKISSKLESLKFHSMIVNLKL